MEIFQLKEALKKLDELTESLPARLSNANAISASSPGPFLNGDQAVAQACQLYRNIWCSDDQPDGRETPIAIGAIGCSQDALQLAMEINETKLDLHRKLLKLRVENCHCGSVSGRGKSFRRLLGDIGLGRLSVRQVNRLIPILDQCPKKIDFSYSTKGKSITRLTAAQALDRISASGMEGSHIEIQIKKLMGLPRDYPLAQVQHLQGYFKANIRYNDGSRRTMAVFLPILYPLGSVPVVLPAELCGARRRPKVRKDFALSETPFIPSLRLYLYRDQY